MKIIRYVAPSGPAWGILDGERDTISPLQGDIDVWGPAVCNGTRPGTSSEAIRLSDVKLLPPIGRQGQVFVAGANYSRHLAEINVDAPVTPVIFLKSSRALISANDPIRYPSITKQLDFEVELVVVIGDALAPGSDPMTSVLGYTIGNDVSARDLQKGSSKGIGMDLFSAKSLDGTTGVGPWIVTRDEFGNAPPHLTLKTMVNGELRQSGSTAEMRWPVDALLAYLNERVALRAGDILFTGTPEGVALGGGGRYLKIGDVVEVSVERIGTMSQSVVS